ncbi:hypothetical protein ANMWB30_24320 [Arthrobacter sp. MWB30]|nr:hypothetical protein ANMWB30_24320 [Arthrobacter sp. MWB30]
MDAAIRYMIHQDAVTMDIHALTRELAENLGTGVVREMAGAKNRTTPQMWQRADGPVPRPVPEARLRLGYRVWKTLALHLTPDVALAWLRASNPRLDEETPLTYIQGMFAKQVLTAAEAFLGDGEP